MIKRIEAYRYRCFERLDVAFENFQVIVGANGSGKSTLLDIVPLLSDMLRYRRVDSAFFEKTGVHPRARAERAEELIFNQQGEFFSIVLEVELPEEVVATLVERVSSRMSPKRAEQYRKRREVWPELVRYELQCEKLNDLIQVSQEYLLAIRGGEKQRPAHGAGLVGELQAKRSNTVLHIIRRPRGEPAVFSPEGRTRSKEFQFRFDPTELALANVPSDQEQFAAALWFRNFLAQGTCFYKPDISVLREASSVRTRNLRLSLDGSSLPWLIKKLKEAKEQTRYKRWLDLVRLALPSITNIVPVVREDDGSAYFRIIYESKLSVPSWSLSDGTLNILALTILPYLDSLPDLISIEEPENGVHPKAVQVITEALASTTTAQVWTSSHSPIVLSNVNLRNVLCLSQSLGGAVTATAGDKHPKLAEWKGGVDLGTLFAAGVFS